MASTRDESNGVTILFSISEDQQIAGDCFQHWLNATSNSEFRLGGLAGTGKTTLVKAFDSLLDGDAEVFAPTARAAVVLKSKGVNAKTLASLLLRFEYEKEDEQGKLVPVFSDKRVSREIIIVDEASMVSSEMYAKVRRCANRVVWIGDYGQLPPVESGVVGKSVVSEELLDAKLTMQHRHIGCEDIIDFANHLRAGLDPADWKKVSNQVLFDPPGVEGTNLVSYLLSEKLWPVICYTNDFRRRLNAAIRQAKGFPAHGACKGLMIVCAKNNYSTGIANGELFTVESAKGSEVKTACGRSFDVTFDPKGSGVVVEDGYAITCHKAQGSEFDRVAVIEDMIALPSWRYTAATRAKNKVVYFKSE